MSANGIVEKLVGRCLSDCRIVKMTEVYKVDSDGRVFKTLGCFLQKGTAEAFITTQADAAYHGTRQVLVLTNGSVGFKIECTKGVRLIEDEIAVNAIRTKVIEGLSPEVRKVLGL